MNGDHFRLLITCGATIWETVLNRNNAGTSDFRNTPAISKQSLRIFPSKFCQRKKPDQFLDLLKMPEIKETAWKSTKAKDLKWSFHILEAGLKHNPRTHASKQADRQRDNRVMESMKNKASEIWQTRTSVPLQPRIPYPLRKIDSKHFTTRRSSRVLQANQW